MSLVVAIFLQASRCIAGRIYRRLSQCLVRVTMYRRVTVYHGATVIVRKAVIYPGLLR